MTLIEQGIGGYITNGVYVVTTKAGEKINGQAAAWITKVSEDPFLVLIALYEKNYTTELVRQSNIFAVNILKEGQEEIARHFGKSGRKINKFKGIKFHQAKTGAPILDNCLAYLDCEVVLTEKPGDHVIFVGEVVEEGIQSKGKPLIYRHEDYF
jgi:flavin reductase (DIM6/NTAB) family NADH-FMN oxidoreductase RutF